MAVKKNPSIMAAPGKYTGAAVLVNQANTEVISQGPTTDVALIVEVNAP